MSTPLSQTASLLRLACAVALAGMAQAQTETVLHSFASLPGRNPYAGVIRDSAGNFYGTTRYGGTAFEGAVYSVDATGQGKVLYSFWNGEDGGQPFAGVIRDAAGNLYGTTFQGGIFTHHCGGGCGVVYKVDPSGRETVLHRFKGSDGSGPYAGVIRDSAGNLYGTTYAGGAANAGVVYKLDAAGAFTVLYSFTGGADGANPYAGVILDSAGNLYGTTEGGGTSG